ncbi:transposase [Streptomyces rectiviolaceus]|uniref:transposase n=1 Tax=Streptomyces rectiviolaceus TaxID=332591 RepID=UPI003CD0B613
MAAWLRPGSGAASQVRSEVDRRPQGADFRWCRPKDTTGFVVVPRRWVIERSLAWMMNARRHARDYERLVQHSETLITWAAITLMTRRITR